MFPLILTVLNRDYSRGYYNPLQETVSKGGKIPNQDSILTTRETQQGGCWHRVPKLTGLGLRVWGLGFRVQVVRFQGTKGGTLIRDLRVI